MSSLNAKYSRQNPAYLASILNNVRLALNEVLRIIFSFQHLYNFSIDVTDAIRYAYENADP